MWQLMSEAGLDWSFIGLNIALCSYRHTMETMEDVMECLLDKTEAKVDASPRKMKAEKNTNRERMEAKLNDCPLKTDAWL